MAEPSTATEMVRVPILGENGRISDDYVPEAIPQAVTAVKQAAEAAASSASDALKQSAAAEKSASSAASSVEQAKTYASNASTYMTTAESHAESAASDATAAAQSASDAAASAEAAAQSASSIGTAAFDAQAAATAARESASQAATSASEASASATAADDASQDAETSASNAKASETAANSSATKAAASASQAASSATAAAGSATNAAGFATAAEKSKNDAQAILNEANAKFIESATATTLDPGQPATAEVVDNVLNLGIPQGAKGDKGDTGTGVPDGGTPGQFLSKTDSGTAWVDPPTGNVLKGTATGYVAHAEDAYATKPRRLTVYGETRQNLWVNPSGTNGGITCTSNDDGSLSISGSTTTNVTFASQKVFSLRKGEIYTVSVDEPVSSSAYGSLVVVQHASDGSLAVDNTYFGFAGMTSVQFKCSENTECAEFQLYLSVSSGGTLNNGTYRVMLNEGSEAQPWCPPGLNGVDELSIVTAGKNIFQPPHGTSMGVTCTENEDGSFTISGEATNYGEIFSDKIPIIPGTQLTYRRSAPPGGYDVYAIYYYANGEFLPYGQHYQFNKSSGTFTVPENTAYIGFRYSFNASAPVIAGTYRYQLELGSTATAYEPPAVTTTPVDLDGHTLNSLPDGTRDELRIDGTGAVTMVQRVGVATAPTAASGWTYVDIDERANFLLTDQAVSQQNDESGFLLCDKLPPRKVYGAPSYALVGYSLAYAKNPAITSTATAATVAGGAIYLYPLATPQEVELPPVTLPALPAPTFNVYHDADVPSDTSVEYARDINLVLANLESVQAALLGGE